MKLNNRFIFGILSLVLAAVIAFVALPTIARQTNGKAEIIRITQPVLKGEKITSDNTEVVEVGGYNLPSNVAHSLSDVEGLYVTADLAEGDYILTSKVSSVPVSSDVALNDIPSGKVAISMTVKTLASGLSDKLQPNDIIRIYHFLETAKEVPELRFVKARCQIPLHTAFGPRDDLAPLLHLKLHTILALLPFAVQFQLHRIRAGQFIAGRHEADQMVSVPAGRTGLQRHLFVSSLHTDNAEPICRVVINRPVISSFMDHFFFPSFKPPWYQLSH